MYRKPVRIKLLIIIIYCFSHHQILSTDSISSVQNFGTKDENTLLTVSFILVFSGNHKIAYHHKNKNY